MEGDESHPFPNPTKDALHDFVLHLAMRGVAPPEQHVSRGQYPCRQAVFGFLQSCGPNLETHIFAQPFGNAAMHSIGINFPHDRVLALVDVLAPDGDADRFGHG